MGSSRVVLVGPSVSARGGIARMIGALLASELADWYRLEAISTISGHRGAARYFALPAALVRFVWIALRRRPDLVHVHSASWTSFPRKRLFIRLSRALGIPVVLQIHGGGFLTYIAQQPRRERSVRRALETCCAVVVLSSELAEPLAAIDPTCEIRVIPNAVEVPATPTTGMDSLRVVFSGRPAAGKGIGELLEASRVIASRIPGFRLVVAGDDIHHRLADGIRGSSLESVVEVRGWLDRNELDRVYAESAVFALPSHVEAMPVSLLEAMSYGLACVATPVGAIPQILSDGENGLIVPVGDATVLERALERLLTDEQLRRRLGASARETVRRRYSMASVARQIRDVYVACGVRPLAGAAGTDGPHPSAESSQT